jgi:predicted transcriptional regulator
VTQFSNKLETLINKSGSNKYRLSKELGIDRVTLYRFINGERVPKKDVVDKICATLLMSPNEEKELRELYGIARIGDGVYEHRLSVKELISSI